jgi:SAM-dependent methyltransferase
MWDNFVNWEKRLKTEGPFLLRQLPRNAKVFDARAGTGIDSLFLAKNGYAVTCNEPDPNFLEKIKSNSADPKFPEKARINAGPESPAPAFTSYSWMNLGQCIQQRSFDAVICLGNSFTCLMGHEGMSASLYAFFGILKYGGVLIVDTLNYDHILDDRKSILRAGNFRYSGNYVYCGIDRVRTVPLQISEDNMVLEFTDVQTKETAHLFAYPLRRTELHELLVETGFKHVSFFSDYRPVLDTRADFYQFVCTRCKPEAI